MGIEGVPQPIADVVDTQYGQKNHETRNNGRPGSGEYLIEGIFEHVAPGCGGRLNTETQKAESGFGDDRIRHTETGRNNNGA